MPKMKVSIAGHQVNELAVLVEQVLVKLFSMEISQSRALIVLISAKHL
jgi:hypothetical protein